MRYKLFGRSGLRVSELCLGTMTFGEEWGWGADQKESRRIFDTFVEAGGNFFDTANRYTEGTSERYLGECIQSDRERYVVATKYTLHTRRDEVNSNGNHRKNMMQALNNSLRRLGTDYIDVYWLHAWDFTTPEDEVMRALDDMVRAGKIMYIGISDTPAWIVSRCNTLAELRGWTQFVGLQIEYSLIQRTPERDLLPMARAFDMAVTPWAVLGGGVLTGKYGSRSDRAGRLGEESTRLSDRNLGIARTVVDVAAEIGCKPAHVAINWVRRRPGLMIPLIGARNAAQLQDNLAALEHQLSDEHMQRLDEVSRIEMGFPHDFLSGDNIRDVLFGGTWPLIDNHRQSV